MAQNDAIEIGNIIDTSDETESQQDLMTLMKEEVGRAKNENLPILRAFEIIARKTGLKPNTIRNYYYRYIHSQDHQGADAPPALKRTVKRRFHNTIGKAFTDEETRYLMMEMLQAQAAGESVRGCAHRLSNGYIRLLIRLQNKYRNMIAKEPEYVRSLIEEMKKKGMNFFDPYTKEYYFGDKNVESIQSSSHSSSAWDSEAAGKITSEEDFLEITGQLISNIQALKSFSLYDFFKGLKDLSGMAVELERRKAGNTDSALMEVDYLKKQIFNLQNELKRKDTEIQDMHNKNLIYETKLEEFKNRYERTVSLYRQLISTNRKFMRLSSQNKISYLKDYTNELEDQLINYEDAARE